MRATFLYTLTYLARQREVLIWALAFPIIMATLFFAVLGNVDETYSIDPVKLVVVEDANYAADTASAFRETIAALSAAGDDQLLDPVAAPDQAAARALLEPGDYYGYVYLDAEGWPHYVGDARHNASTNDPSAAVVKLILDRYSRNAALVTEIAAAAPGALADDQFFAALFSGVAVTQAISVTDRPPSDMIRYMYVVLGFAAFMVATIASSAVTAARANLSVLGARRTVGGLSQVRTLTATLGACWVLSTAVLLIAFLYIRYVLGLDFAGRGPVSAVTLAVAGLTGTLIGAVVGALPLASGAKGGIIAGLSCFLSLFAGMYGPPSQQLADLVARDLPLAAWANPVRQVYDAFMAIYYYDNLDHLWPVLGRLIAFAAICFAAAALLMRRQRYDHL